MATTTTTTIMATTTMETEYDFGLLGTGFSVRQSFFCQQFVLTHFYYSTSTRQVRFTRGFGIVRGDFTKLNAEIYISWNSHVFFSRSFHFILVCFFFAFHCNIQDEEFPILPWEISFKCISQCWCNFFPFNDIDSSVTLVYTNNTIKCVRFFDF